MASHARTESGTPADPQDRPRHRRSVVKDGYLPVNEILFDRAGAPSPFGEEITFPLPVEALRYEHAPRRAEAESHH